MSFFYVLHNLKLLIYQRIELLIKKNVKGLVTNRIFIKTFCNIFLFWSEYQKNIDYNGNVQNSEAINLIYGIKDLVHFSRKNLWILSHFCSTGCIISLRVNFMSYICSLGKIKRLKIVEKCKESIYFSINRRKDGEREFLHTISSNFSKLVLNLMIS